MIYRHFLCSIFFLHCTLGATHFGDLNINNKLKPVKSCVEILDTLQKFSIVPGETASKSLKMFAEMKDTAQPVFIKAYTNSEEMDVEGTIYTNHVKYFLDNDITPHLVRGFYFIQCSESNETILNNLKSFLPESTAKLNAFAQTLKEPERLSIIVTQRIENSITMKTYDEKSLSTGEEELDSILFQLFYTLKAFEQIGLYHGDLHLNNILLEKKPWKATYEYGGKIYQVVSPYTLKIFDFDKSLVIKDKTTQSPLIFQISNQEKRANYDKEFTVLEQKFLSDFSAAYMLFWKHRDIYDLFYKEEPGDPEDVLALPEEKPQNPSLDTIIEFFGRKFLQESPDAALRRYKIN